MINASKSKKGTPSTLHEVAAAAGVSLSTAGNILRPNQKTGRTLFSEETARRVRSVAESLGYSPNRSARAMRTRRSGVMGFVSVNYSAKWRAVENFTVYPFLVGLNHVFAPLGWHVALIELDELELNKRQNLPDALRERFFDGLVVQFGLSLPALDRLEESGVPLIHWDSGSFGKFNCISRDEVQVSRAITQRLIDRGHRKIAFSTGLAWAPYKNGEAMHFSFPARYESYERTMKDNNLKPRILKSYESESLAEQIEEQSLTAAVCQSGSLDYIALLGALLRLGRKLPDDFSILACDVESSVKSRGESSGGALYDRYQAGRLAAEMLLERLNNDAQPVSSVPIPFSIDDSRTVATRS